jgi:hypothetical protein
MKEEEKDFIKPTDEDINYLVENIFEAFRSKDLIERCTNLYILVGLLCEAFEEKSYLKKLNDIWFGVNEENKLKLQIPKIEFALAKELTNPDIKLNKKYHVQGDFGGKAYYTLHDFNFLLKLAVRDIMQVFWKVKIKHSIKLPYKLPEFSADDSI